VAVIDDDGALVEVVRVALRGEGVEAVGFSSAEAFLESRSGRYDLILCDLSMPGMTGLQLLEEVRRKDPQAWFVLMTGEGTIEIAVEAMKKGASDFLAKPFRLGEIQLLAREVKGRIGVAAAEDVSGAPDFVIGRAPVWRQLLERARRVADLPTTVLIRGETGSGKEVLAKYLASFGPRVGKPFVAINCAAVPETLLESELFGHARGAFSGADVARRGLFEEAHGGTLFLDEAGSMGLGAQGKLLRVLEDRTVRRVGENRTIAVDVRIIAATNVNLEDAVARGAFRADLYFRLAVVTLQIPPLRERREDIPLLAAHFLQMLTPPGGTPRRLSPEALALLGRYPFPGNVRELRNAIEQALVFSTGPVLFAEDLASLSDRSESLSAGAPADATVETVPVTWERVQEALVRTNGNRVDAAKLLGISRSTLYRVLRQTEVEPLPS